MQSYSRDLKLIINKNHVTKFSKAFNQEITSLLLAKINRIGCDADL